MASTDAAVLDRAAREILDDTDAVGRDVADHILARDAGLRTAEDEVRRAAVANTGALISTLRFSVPASSVDVPEGALDVLDHLATAEDGLPRMLRAYRLGASALWEHWFRAVSAASGDVGQLDRLTALSSAHFADFVDRISLVIAERWAETTRRVARSDRHRDAAVRAVLAGERPDLASFDHPVEAPQIVVAAAPLPSAPADAVAAVLDRAARAAGNPARLEHTLDAGGVTVMWLAVTEVPAAADLAALRGAARAARAWSVLASSAGGVEGFADAAWSAIAALRVLPLRAGRSSGEGAVATADELALDALLLEDPVRARRFVTTTLGPLADGSTRSARLRETLRAYYACAQRKTAAAGALGLHEKTVAYRLRTIEESLGVQVDARRATLEAALAAHELLTAAPSSGPGSSRGAGG